MLSRNFFNRDTITTAKALLGKILRARYDKVWLCAQIIETEAYFQNEKGSHASLGYTDKRKALFMSPGTIYMYYARGFDSLNVSCRGKGNAVLIKSGYPYKNGKKTDKMIPVMQKLNPPKYGNGVRPIERLCAGQTLLCKSLGITVKEWDQQQFDPNRFYIEDIGSTPTQIIQTTRLGIPVKRDDHLLYRFIDSGFSKFCTSNPLTKRNYLEGKHYRLIRYLK